MLSDTLPFKAAICQEIRENFQSGTWRDKNWNFQGIVDRNRLKLFIAIGLIIKSHIYLYVQWHVLILSIFPQFFGLIFSNSLTVKHKMNWFFFIDKREKTENKKKTQPNMLSYTMRAGFQRLRLSALAKFLSGGLRNVVVNPARCIQLSVKALAHSWINKQ